jgi:hypothetical protein
MSGTLTRPTEGGAEAMGHMTEPAEPCSTSSPLGSHRGRQAEAAEKRNGMDRPRLGAPIRRDQQKVVKNLRWSMSKTVAAVRRTCEKQLTGNQQE